MKSRNKLRVAAERRRGLFPPFTLAASCFPPVSARAELPPSAYCEWQHDAPEFLEIKVVSVVSETREGASERITTVSMRAEVFKVHGSVSRLLPGATIEIRYTTTEHKGPWVGPSQISILEGETKCPADLKRDTSTEKFYEPAADGYSFRQAANR